jgi:hypothetical protein
VPWVPDLPRGGAAGARFGACSAIQLNHFVIDSRLPASVRRERLCVSVVGQTRAHLPRPQRGCVREHQAPWTSGVLFAYLCTAATGLGRRGGGVQQIDLVQAAWCTALLSPPSLRGNREMVRASVLRAAVLAACAVMAAGAYNCPANSGTVFRPSEYFGGSVCLYLIQKIIYVNIPDNVFLNSKFIISTFFILL